VERAGSGRARRDVRRGSEPRGSHRGGGRERRGRG
jgi:hypothetical protein